MIFCFFFFFVKRLRHLKLLCLNCYLCRYLYYMLQCRRMVFRNVNFSSFHPSEYLLYSDRRSGLTGTEQSTIPPLRCASFKIVLTFWSLYFFFIRSNTNLLTLVSTQQYSIIILQYDYLLWMFFFLNEVLYMLLGTNRSFDVLYYLIQGGPKRLDIK